MSSDKVKKVSLANVLKDFMDPEPKDDFDLETVDFEGSVGQKKNSRKKSKSQKAGVTTNSGLKKKNQKNISNKSEQSQDEDTDQSSESDEDFDGSKLNSKKSKGAKDKSDTKKDSESSLVKNEIEKLLKSQASLANDMQQIKKQDALKGKNVINQLKIWESVLDLRIRFQKLLQKSNELGRFDEIEKVASSLKEDVDIDIETFKEKAKPTVVVLNKLVSDIVGIQKGIFEHIPEISNKQKNTGDNDSDDSNKKRKANSSGNAYSDIFSDSKDLWDQVENNRERFKKFKNETLLKWDSRVNAILPGKLGSKNLKSFNRTVLEQIEQIMVNKERLVSRTKTPRIQYNFVLNLDSDKNAEDEATPKVHDIYDDTDFYQSLLRDLIDSRSSAQGSGSARGGGGATTELSSDGLQWTSIQKSMTLASKKSGSKVVDTKASKGRKLRYQVFEKLENFMTPQAYTFSSNGTSTGSGVGVKGGAVFESSYVAPIWTEMQIQQLFSNLLGQNNNKEETNINNEDKVEQSKEKVDEKPSEIETRAQESMDTIRLFNF
ncbi:hypothetical protein BB560_003544 [Smittium megazygosporum]|uniref:Protein BFR2 n=1 Tax=Smittium megazygosporum TaxID=133381 RepID=A0A2T9ZBN8_9FUNG|nr:hypothetical protein BB560_003544 [Smittium megazygosporum]